MPHSFTRQYRCIIFDMDGVLLDSRSNMEGAWQAVCDACGIDIPFASYFAEIGRPFSDIMHRLGIGPIAREAEVAFRSQSAATIADAPIYEGIGGMLQMLHDGGIRCAVVTSKDSIRTALVLDRLPIAFDIVVSPRDDLRGKPAPDSLLYAMAKMNVDPADTIFIGDMDSDEQAARRAGIAYAHANWGYGAPADEASIRLASPSDVISIARISEGSRS